MNDIAIRPTQPVDLPSIAAVLDETGLFPSEFLAEMIAPFFERASSDTWLTCVADGESVGFCYAAPEDMADRVSNMRAIAVRPHAQGRGCGAALVGALEATLRDSGSRLLIVDTSGAAGFENVRRFYSGLGYEFAATIADFWEDGDDKVTFRKRLA